MNIKYLSLILLAGLFCYSSMAQNTDKKTETVTVIADGDKVLINGVPSDKIKDEDLEKMSHKKIKVNVRGKDGFEFNMPPFEFETEVRMGNGAFLGVLTEKNEKGVKIIEVTKESAAAKAGLQANDIITKINDSKIETPTELVETIHSAKPGDKIKILYLRDGVENTTTAILGKRKETDIKSFKMDEGDFNFHMPKMYDFKKSFPFDYHMNNNGGRPKLGIEIEDLEEGNGVKVTDVDAEMVAGKAGLKEDDLIKELNGKEIKSVDDLKTKLKDLKEGESFKLGILRAGKTQSIDIKFPKKLKKANL